MRFGFSAVLALVSSNSETRQDSAWSRSCSASSQTSSFRRRIVVVIDDVDVDDAVVANDVSVDDVDVDDAVVAYDVSVDEERDGYSDTRRVDFSCPIVSSIYNWRRG